MIFVDASALIAMMTGEPEADRLADILAGERARLSSPVALWEATAGLCRSYRFGVSGARALVKDFCAAHGIEVVSLGERDYELAIEAYGEFGKGRHEAALNMGDCFAYASAKAHRPALLFTGGDFSRTGAKIAGTVAGPENRL